uniref:ShdA n=1 Tax=uncultured bacterium BAC AB649/1850 TaxID=1037453 RepID=F6K0Z5_9BACT|nr:ShdA [uncultured bacterium BAC AB649/1850]
MRTYYRGPDALITQDRLVWYDDITRTYLIRDLRTVGIVQDGSTGRRRAAAVAAIVLGPAAAVAWLQVSPVAGAVLGFLAFAAVIISVTAAPMRTVHVRQLQAHYRGVVTTVYESADERVFNQVTRALRRSLEDYPRTRHAPDLAAA